MSDQIPIKLKYTKTHEWVRFEENGTVTTGITHHAQALLGDVVHLEFPEEGQLVTAGDEIGVIESVKAAADIYCPVSGVVLTRNLDLQNTPELVNQVPYGAGWLLKLQPENKTVLTELLDAAAYQKLLESEAH